MKYLEHTVDGKTTHFSNEDGTSVFPAGHRLHKKMPQDIADGIATKVMVDDTPVITWEDQMAASDLVLPRWAEDIADAVVSMGGVLPKETADKIAAKKALRASGK